MKRKPNGHKKLLNYSLRYSSKPKRPMLQNFDKVFYLRIMYYLEEREAQLSSDDEED